MVLLREETIIVWIGLGTVGVVGYWVNCGWGDGVLLLLVLADFVCHGCEDAGDVEMRREMFKWG